MAKYYFCAIAGSGMSAIAQITKLKGNIVEGSDRSFDMNENSEIKEKLINMGIKIHPQNGKALDKTFDYFIYSTAVEENNLEYMKAKELGINMLHRSEILERYVAEKKTIAVGGTSGKTTLTAMIWHILNESGFKPSLINGGFLISLMERKLIGNAFYGDGEYLVIEADESDSTIERYHPYISLIHNITKDHKDTDELKKIFTRFALNSKKVFLNDDDSNINDIKKYLIDFTPYTIKDVEIKKTELYRSHFRFRNTDFIINAGGIHNIYNALAAINVCMETGCEIGKISKALESFKGTFRRFNIIGEINGITVIDDYAHNPHKISSTLTHLVNNACGRRIITLYQPHGFAPTRMFKNELIEIFSNIPRENDIIIVLPIYYAGGTVQRDISSRDITDAINKKRKAYYFEKRDEIISFIKETAVKGDIIILMGARDPTLNSFAKQIFTAISQKYDKIYNYEHK